MQVATNINARMAADADLQQIKQLYAVWGQAFDYLLNDQTFVVEVDERIVAAVRLAFEEAIFIVRSLYVDKDFRSLGIAKALLEIVEVELGIAEAYCIAFTQQESLFAGIDFQPIVGLNAPDFLISRKENMLLQGHDVICMKRSVGVEIRPLPARDLPLAMLLINELELHLIKQLSANDVRSIYSKINAAGGTVFGAYRGSKMIGTCTLNVCANLSWSGRSYGIVENIIVTKDERGKGIGRSLLLFARRTAESKNCYKVTVMTRLKDPETGSFYRSAGFSEDKAGFQRHFSVER